MKRPAQNIFGRHITRARTELDAHAEQVTAGITRKAAEQAIQRDAREWANETKAELLETIATTQRMGNAALKILNDLSIEPDFIVRSGPVIEATGWLIELTSRAGDTVGSLGSEFATLQERAEVRNYHEGTYIDEHSGLQIFRTDYAACSVMPKKRLEIREQDLYNGDLPFQWDIKNGYFSPIPYPPTYTSFTVECNRQQGIITLLMDQGIDLI